MTDERYEEIASAIEAMSLSDLQMAQLAHHGLATDDNPELVYVLADQAGLNNPRGLYHDPKATTMINRRLATFESGAIAFGPGQTVESVLSKLAGGLG